MATNAEHTLQAADVEQRQVVSGEAPDVSTDDSSAEAAVVVNSIQRIEAKKFPGTGRTLSGKVIEGEEEEAPGSDGGESAYHSSNQDDEDEYDEDDGYESDEDSASAAIVRGGSGSYNLRSPGAIKRKIRDVGVSDDDRGPALRTRRKTIPDYAEDEDEEPEDDDEESE